ncbi:glutamyl-tRNA amidotransferase [bacterium BRH_c32]|nr:MAG: glutamyl-tRNA amidotransferase [bacterium BRH_c32]
MTKFETVIGLEIHAQLLTKTKLFCSCSTKFGNPPNSNICPICLGHPGVLPVLNKNVVEFAIMMGLAVNCSIREFSTFARKNYFYPDLPKGYQISQYDEPICENGYVFINSESGEKKIRILRIHMEEDAGKSIHDQGYGTLVDVNRCGVPLIEIVTEPDLNSPSEAFQYLNKIKQILTYLGICDGNMEEGSLRCDANISIRAMGETALGTKTEIKNMNSFRNVERALTYEIERQIDLVENGGKVIQQTLLWNADKNEAYPMRSKEEAHDYRYFPDPDLVKLHVNEKWKNEIKNNLPELPEAKFNRFLSDFNLPQYDAEVLTSSRELANYFEEVTLDTKDYKSASNWTMGEILKLSNELNLSPLELKLTPKKTARLIELINQNIISNKTARDIVPDLINSVKSPDEIIKAKNLIQISDDSFIIEIVNKVIDENPTEVKEYNNGKEKLIGFFVGKIMQLSKGKANPQIVNKILKESLLAKK